jgi:hypothetical protein
VAWLWLFDSHVPFEPGSIRIMFDRIYQMDTVTLLLEYGDVTSPLLLLAFQRAAGKRRLGHWAAVRNMQDYHHRDVAWSRQRRDLRTGEGTADGGLMLSLGAPPPSPTCHSAVEPRSADAEHGSIDAVTWEPGGHRWRRLLPCALGGSAPLVDAVRQ